MAKTMRIAFPRGGTVPAGMVSEEEKQVSAHEPVNVPLEYGRQLVDDRFAYEATDTERAAPGKRRGADQKADLAVLQKAVDDARATLAAATELDARSAAQATLDEAERNLAAVGA